MFVGHFAVGLAAKRAVPRVSLGTTFLACQLLDLIWPVLVLAGVERVRVDHAATAFTPLAFEHYPWSHSLGMSLVWSLLAFLLTRALKRSRIEATVVAAVVFSHWMLDLLSHRPDLPLWLGQSSTKLGLGLWNSVPATVAVELAIFVVGVGMYWRTKRAPEGRRWVFWTLIAFLTLVYFGNAFGPKPPLGTPPAVIVGPALALWLIVAWAYWADRARGSSR